MEVEQFAEIVRRHQAGVCAVAYGVTGDRALSEDIAQDTFLAAWRGASTLRDPSRLRGWLHGIARNLAHKARRRRRMAGLALAALRVLRDAAELDQDHQLAMDIDALPHALANGRRVHGALPVATCPDAVARALRRARIAEARGVP